ncbi:MAG: hypothetical protein ACM3TR_10905 [Caulobacteraceae bacterium]
MLDEYAVTSQYVCDLNNKVITILNLSIVDKRVFISPGAIRHARSEHGKDFFKYFQLLPQILSSPEYCGIYPNKANCIEVVKKIDDFVTIGLKINNTSGPLSISSFYMINDSKCKARINKGRYHKI